MRLPANVANHALAVLLEHSGLGSYQRFVEAVHARAHARYGITLGYDHLSVKRWLPELATDCAPYRDAPAVRDLHTRLTPT